MRRSLQFILFTGASLIVFMSLPLHARRAQQQAHGKTAVPPALHGGLHVTDLCLSTEARYTRHPAMADRHAPFQEHPLALEHFPSGALIMPNISGRDKP